MKIFSAFLFVVMLSLGVASAQSTNTNALVGRAHQAVGNCVGQAQQSIDGQIQHNVGVVGSCFNGGFLYRVSFYHVVFGPPCNPTEEDPCHPPLPVLELVATVDFDCAGNIIGSECYWGN